MKFKIPKNLCLKSYYDLIKKLVYKSVNFLKRAKRKNEKNIYFNFDDEFIQPRVYFLQYFYLDVY